MSKFICLRKEYQYTCATKKERKDRVGILVLLKPSVFHKARFHLKIFLTDIGNRAQEEWHNTASHFCVSEWLML